MPKVYVHLYGEFRKYTGQVAYDHDSVAEVEIAAGDSIADALGTLGIGAERVGLAFLNGELSHTTRALHDGDRLGVFPENMSLLYKWYFEKKG